MKNVPVLPGHFSFKPFLLPVASFRLPGKNFRDSDCW